MKKNLLLFIATFSFVFSSVAQLEITTNISNLSGDINDGKILVEVSGGEEPYEFYWSNKSTSLDSDFSEKLTEGVEYSVKITDANGLCDSLYFIIESESVQEKINNAFI
ncbi:MAG: SprB repeat-containing protein, partial [Flavobacteriales bacterium]